MTQLNYYIKDTLLSPSPLGFESQRLAGEGGGEGEHISSTPTLVLPRHRLRRKSGKVKNVMLNLFQHLKESKTYETLK